MSKFVFCGLPGSKIFFSLFSHKQHDFGKTILEENMFLFLYNLRLKYSSFREEMIEIGSKMYIIVHVKYLLF